MAQVRPGSRAERDAVILAPTTRSPRSSIAYHPGDSLGAVVTAAEVDASTIVIYGMHFVAESPKILSYDRPS